MYVWPKERVEKGIVEALEELEAAEAHWLAEKAIADRILMKADYRLSRATRVYTKFRELLSEFGEVSEAAFPEAPEASTVQYVRAVEPAPFSSEKMCWIQRERARLYAESVPKTLEPKRYLSFASGCFSPEHVMFSR